MRLVGVNIPDNKRVEVALTYIYGVGPARARELTHRANVHNTKRAKDLTPEELAKIKTLIEDSFKIEGELRQTLRQNVNRLKNIKSYRGSRHAKRLPARGQRTKTNSRTIRGNVRVTAGSGKKKLTKT
ncbi:MAG: 30S ribosomal protein S13 [Candidatus Colwellbacteria bacterium]|nr:30S ribosomal protein S13 [Candidatus Colwellbacteria bacterium]